MPQIKITFEESQIYFLESYKQYGFKDKSSMVREALKLFQKEIERKELEESADLYAEVYAEDADLQELTQSANRISSYEQFAADYETSEEMQKEAEAWLDWLSPPLSPTKASSSPPHSST